MEESAPAQPPWAEGAQAGRTTRTEASSTQRSPRPPVFLRLRPIRRGYLAAVLALRISRGTRPRDAFLAGAPTGARASPPPGSARTPAARRGTARELKLQSRSRRSRRAPTQGSARGSEWRAWSSTACSFYRCCARSARMQQLHRMNSSRLRGCFHARWNSTCWGL